MTFDLNGIQQEKQCLDVFCNLMVSMKNLVTDRYNTMD